MYKMLALQRGDIIIEEKSLVDAELLKDRHLKESIVLTTGIGSTLGFHILIGKESEYASIIDELNTIIDEMLRDGTIAKILTEYGL